MKEDYIISNYKDKVFKLLDKVLRHLNNEKDLKTFTIKKVWENHILNIYVNSSTLKFYNGMAYCLIRVEDNILNMVINDLEVAVLHKGNNDITDKFIEYIKYQTKYVDSMLNDIINELDNM